MRALATVLWHFPFLGFLSAIYMMIGGALCTLTVVGAPLGTGLFELGKFLFAPFGHRMVDASMLNTELSRNTTWRVWGWVLMVIWLPFGLIATFFLILQVFFCCITIIGIPVGVAAARSITTVLNPVGKKVITTELYNEIKRRKASSRADAFLGAGAATTSKPLPAQRSHVVAPSAVSDERNIGEGQGKDPSNVSQAFLVPPEAGSSNPVNPSRDIQLTIPKGAIKIGAAALGVLIVGGVTLTVISGMNSSGSGIGERQSGLESGMVLGAAANSDASATPLPSAGPSTQPTLVAPMAEVPTSADAAKVNDDLDPTPGSQTWCLKTAADTLAAPREVQQAHEDKCIPVYLELMFGETAGTEMSPGSTEWCRRLIRGRSNLKPTPAEAESTRLDCEKVLYAWAYLSRVEPYSPAEPVKVSVVG